MVLGVHTRGYTQYYLEFIQDTSSYDEIESEIDNIFAAIENCYTISPDWLIISEIADALYDFIRERKYWAVGVELYRMATEAAEYLHDDLARTRHLVYWGRCLYKFGVKNSALDKLNEAIELLTNLKNAPQQLVLEAYIYRCDVLSEQSIWEIADRDGQLATELAKQINDNYSLGRILFIRGVAKIRQDEFDEALILLSESLEIAQELGKLKLEERCLDHLGRIYELKGDLATAEQYYQKSLAIGREIGDSVSVASALNGLGILAIRLNNLQQAQGFLIQALETFKALQDFQGMTSIHTNLGIVTRRLGDFAVAHDHHWQAYQYATDIDDIRHQSINLSLLGSVAINEEKYDQATLYLEQSLQLDRKHGFTHGEAMSLGSFGNLAFERKQFDKALDFYQQCLVIFKEKDDKTSIAMTKGNVGKVYAHLSKPLEARSYLVEAVLLSQEIRVETVTINAIVELAKLSLPAQQDWLKIAYYHPQCENNTRKSLREFLIKHPDPTLDPTVFDHESRTEAEIMSAYHSIIEVLVNPTKA
jgi:tetratricopeptide (TPR) repeat protein